VKLEGKPAQQMVRLMDALEDHDDVQNVSSNFDISEKEIEALAGVSAAAHRMRIFGIDPGSDRTGYGCVDTDGSRHRIVAAGAVATAAAATFPDKLLIIHTRLAALILEHRPDCIAIENLFHAVNARSALKLGHARGVAMLAAVQAGLPVAEYTPRGDQTRGGGLRPRREGAGAADDQAAAGPARGPLAARRGGCARGRHLPRARAPAGARRRAGKDRPARTQQGDELADLPARAAVIAHLRGRLFEKQPNRIVVDVSGVGYDVFVPLSTFYNLGDLGGEIALRIHTHVREDALTLYGFATLLEQDLFERLIGVSGIGPKLALAVLSGIETAELMRAIERADVARLTSIPGVGRKTAERIVLELKDRLPKPPAAAVATPAAGSAVRDDVLSALLNLGYHRPLAEKAVALPSRRYRRRIRTRASNRRYGSWRNRTVWQSPVIRHQSSDTSREC